MMIAAVASIDAVTGSSKAIASAGPIPGRTPTKVPRKVPINPYIKFVAVKAVAKPSSKRLKLFIIATFQIDLQKLLLAD